MREVILKKSEDLYKYIGRTWVEIDLNQLKTNFQIVKSMLAEKTGIIMVLKANAYGHGAVELAKEVSTFGPLGFAVASLDEGLELREHGIEEPILLLSCNELERASEGIEADLTFSLISKEFGEKLSEAAKSLGKKAKVHVTLDSGMGRLGFKTDAINSLQEVEYLYNLGTLEFNGIYTHFATADGHDYSTGGDLRPLAEDYMKQQKQKFDDFVEDLEVRGIHIPLHHVSNSGAIVTKPDFHLEAVRSGIISYGIYPSENGFVPGVQPILSWKTRVMQVKHLKAGDTVSYDRHYVAEKDMTIAVLPVGYADGYDRDMNGSAQVQYKGIKCDVIGTICMDMLMIDCSGLDFEPQVGDVVDLISNELGNDYINVYNHASWRSTIPYEVCTSISYRSPRVYFRNGKAEKIAWL